MLWTDESAHQFMETHYPSFLQMYDSYKYNIQRADSIRYFLLHHFGGIYMDLDIGCRRRIDSLIQGDWEVILPLTKPVSAAYRYEMLELMAGRCFERSYLFVQRICIHRRHYTRFGCIQPRMVQQLPHGHVLDWVSILLVLD